MKHSLAILGICVIICSMIGCKTVAIRYEPNEAGEMIAVEKMELRGVGKNEADFKNKKIKNDSGIKIPEIRIEEFKTD